MTSEVNGDEENKLPVTVQEVKKIPTQLGKEIKDHFAESFKLYDEYVKKEGVENDQWTNDIKNRVKIDLLIVRDWSRNDNFSLGEYMDNVPTEEFNDILQSIMLQLPNPEVLEKTFFNSIRSLMTMLGRPIRLPTKENNSKSSDKANKDSIIQKSWSQFECMDDVFKAKKEFIIETRRWINAENEPQKAIYAYANRLEPSEEEHSCFVCRGKKEGQLIQCEGRHSTKFCCSTRFHEECIKEYNAGDYDYEFLEMSTTRKQCPLHVCMVCFVERRKTSARSGKLTACSKCFKAWHEECLPATVSVKKEPASFTLKNGNVVRVLSESTICHSHLDLSKQEAKVMPFIEGDKGKQLHLPFCCECEMEVNDDDSILMECSSCIRSFHRGCHRYTTLIVDGEEGQARLYCEGCILGETVRSGQHAIARYQNSFYPCVSVKLENYPSHCKSVDKFGKFLGRPGFVAVTWAGCQNLFSLLPASTVVPMFEGSFQLIGKRMKDVDHFNAWKEMEVACEPKFPKPPLDDKYVPIKTSTASGDCKTLKIAFGELDVDGCVCGCDPNEENRCGPNSGCTNRGLGMECPKECEAHPAGCNNRIISNRIVHPHIERREAPGKGYGVFATAPIQKDTVLAEYAGELITSEERNQRIAVSQRSRNNEEMHYMMGLDNQRTIDCKYKGNIARFLNHSCEPNCVIIVKDVILGRKSGKYLTDVRVAVQTLQNVNEGDELCFNYRMDKFSDGVDLPKCRCNAKNCSGKLTGPKSKTSKESNTEKEVEPKRQARATTPGLKRERRAATPDPKRRARAATPDPKRPTRAITPAPKRQTRAATPGVKKNQSALSSSRIKRAATVEPKFAPTKPTRAASTGAYGSSRKRQTVATENSAPRIPDNTDGHRMAEIDLEPEVNRSKRRVTRAKSNRSERINLNAPVTHDSYEQAGPMKRGIGKTLVSADLADEENTAVITDNISQEDTSLREIENIEEPHIKKVKVVNVEDEPERRTKYFQAEVE